MNKSQALLHRMMKQLLPAADVRLDFKSELFYTDSKQPMLFDVYVVTYALALEYQGHQHYAWTPKFGDILNVSN
jgi:uncharacterized protein YdiU (UPF0061 family)